jgi:hypothetical protein
MEMQRRLLSYVAIFIATIYYFFGRADALTPDLPTVTGGPACHQPAEKSRLIQCKPVGQPRR